MRICSTVASDELGLGGIDLVAGPFGAHEAPALADPRQPPASTASAGGSTRSQNFVFPPQSTSNKIV